MNIRLLPFVVSALAATLVAGCALTPATVGAPTGEGGVTPRPSCPACPACPNCPGITPVPPPTEAARPLQPATWEELAGWGGDDPLQALPALRSSCASLGRQKHWKPFCDGLAAQGATPEAARLRRWLEQSLVPWQVVNPDGTREGLITGYYEPIIKGARSRSPRFAWPVHGVPVDMLTVDLGDLYPELKKYRLRGRLVGNKVVPYWSRGELEKLGERLPARPLLWAADPVELFFLQVQGSGRVELPDGSRVRIGYADQNGHPYQSIGRWLIDKGELTLEKASMEGIKAWAQANPGRLADLLQANPSYVFFKELPNTPGGPPGAQGVPLTEGRSIAVDPRTIPLGVPVFLVTTHPNSDQPLNRMVVAQDTGGAIKGAVRADLFWGLGPEAGVLAGRMRQNGRLWVMLPRGYSPE